MLIGRSQTQKSKHYMGPFACVSQDKQIHIDRRQIRGWPADLVLGSAFKLVPVPPSSFEYFLTFKHDKMFQAHLYFPFLNPGHFSKESLFLSVEASIKKSRCEFQVCLLLLQCCSSNCLHWNQGISLASPQWRPSGSRLVECARKGGTYTKGAFFSTSLYKWIILTKASV